MPGRLHALAMAAVAAAAISLLSLSDSRAQSAPKTLDLAIVNGRISLKSDTIRVKKGDQVELRWSSDRPIVLHLHGYDIERKVAPESAAVMSFNANLTGRFPVSEHKHGGRHQPPILYLEVHP
jgi:FtsP/CotA-like multicopper oxidase with cupredoxin domain